jgi:hypothetical protein
MESNGQNQTHQPFCGTIKGAIQLLRNKYGNDDVLTFCCIKVTLLDANNQWVAEEATDDSGNFTFTGVGLQAYTLVFPETIDYQGQKFLPASSEFQHKFTVTLSTQEPLVKSVDIRYVLPVTGSLESYEPIVDARMNA